MIFKRKIFMIPVLLFLGFICLTFRAGAMHYDGENRYGISWDTVDNGHGGTRLVFGQMHPSLMVAYRNKESSLLKSTLTGICKKMNYPKTIVFDGIEYDYNEATETLTVAQVGNSVYATAQQCVIAALTLSNIPEMDTTAVEIQTAIMKRLREENLLDDLDRGLHQARRRQAQIIQEERDRRPLPPFAAKPLRTIVIRGNIIRISDDFCDAHDHITDSSIVIPQHSDHFAQLETIDMSQSNVAEICEGAFPGCKNLRNFVPPVSGSLQRIGHTAFEGSALNIGKLPEGTSCIDPRRPVNEPAFKIPLCPCSWCTTQ